ncbi:MAG: helix-turn-helix transcriptional regulator [Bacteroidales bacterium]|nr:helix-turn-helix transcriptional regulator [Bacteroidales bacterium]
MNRIRKIATIIGVITLLVPFIPVLAQDKAPVTCTAESPVDGAIWMGTQGEGVYRLSNSGMRLRFTAERGNLGSDVIKNLFFDGNGGLWILDDSSTLTNYTSSEGFEKVETGLEIISSAIYSPKECKIILASVTKLFTLDPIEKIVEPRFDLPFEPVSLKLSSDSSFVWLFGVDQVAKLDTEGKCLQWEQNGTLSDSLPLEFETYVRETGPRASIWLIIVLVSLVLAGGITIVLMASKRRPTSSGTTEKSSGVPWKALNANEAKSDSQAKPEAAEKELLKKEKEVEKRSPSVTKSSGFTLKVLALIDDHISDPDFDVETIAALTGMSRIHVNRKLKAEGAPSPSYMIKDKRMSMAKVMLLKGNIPMAQIASECGFRSPSYFTTSFKEYTGLTPSEFVAREKA